MARALLPALLAEMLCQPRNGAMGKPATLRLRSGQAQWRESRSDNEPSPLPADGTRYQGKLNRQMPAYQA